MNIKSILSVGLAGVLAVSLAACGSNSSAKSSEAAAASLPIASASAEASSQGTAEKQVKIAALSTVSKPISWLDENNKIQGYDVDVVEALNEVLEGYTIKIEAYSDELIDVKMESGDADLTTGLVNDTRLEKFNIPQTPILGAATALYIRAEDADKITSLKDIAEGGYKIAPVTPNGGMFNQLTQWNKDNNNVLGEIPVAEGVTVAESLKAVAEGQYDVFVWPNHYNVNGTIKEAGFNIVQAKEPVKKSASGILIQKDDPEFAEAVNNALIILKDNGKLSEIQQKWYGEDMFQYLP